MTIYCKTSIIALGFYSSAEIDEVFTEVSFECDEDLCEDEERKRDYDDDDN